MGIGNYVLIQAIVVTLLDAFVLIRAHCVSSKEKSAYKFKCFAFMTTVMQGLVALMLAFDYNIMHRVYHAQCIAYVTIIFGMTFCTYCWYEFMVDAVLERRRKGMIYTILRVLPMALAFILSFTSIWTGALFTIADDGTFLKGPLYFLQGSFALVYVFAGAGVGVSTFLKSSFEECKDAIRLICAYMIPVAIAVFIQSLGFKGGFTPIAMSIGMMIMYLDLYISDVRINRELRETQAQLSDAMCEQEEQLESIKELNAQLEDARIRAEAANESKSIFLAGMSHEIRTPINAILGMDTMILRTSKDEETLKYALDIQSAGRNLLAIINDILDFSKIESGKMELVEVDYDFASIINDIYNMINTKTTEKGLDFEINVDENVPSRFYGDDIRLRQILVNLLTNAVKYTPEGTVSLNVSKNKDGSVHYAVKDTGIGIKPEDINKLTKRFVRIEEEKNRNIEGTGLGTNIVVALLSMMGSKLEVESVYGEGSEFSFDLMQRVTDDTPLGDIGQRIKHSNETVVEHVVSYTIPDCKLLVVDDNDMNRVVFKAFLRDLGCQIDEAESGKKCLELVLENKYDIIFMDHMMPEMDGVNTFHYMKAYGDYINADTPVIILTANAVTGAKEYYMEEGFDDYLSKPIDADKLEAMIEQLIPDSKKKPVASASNSKKMGLADANKKAAESSFNENKKDVEELPFIDGIDWNCALKNLVNIDFVRETIDDFLVMSNPDIRKLHSMYEELTTNDEAFKDFRVHVHSMKSNAALIGANHVAGLAKYLEYAARDEDMTTIKELLPTFEREWGILRTELEKNFAKSQKIVETTAENAIDPDELKYYFDMLKEAMAETDFDRADAVIEALSEYTYPEDEAEYFEELKACVLNMDEEAFDAIVLKW